MNEPLIFVVPGGLQFKDGLAPAKIQEVVGAFAGLPEKIDTIIGLEQGTHVSEEGKSEGFTHCFVVTFRDEKGLATYLDHPAFQEYLQVVRTIATRSSSSITGPASHQRGSSRAMPSTKAWRHHST